MPSHVQSAMHVCHLCEHELTALSTPQYAAYETMAPQPSVGMDQTAQPSGNLNPPPPEPPVAGGMHGQKPPAAPAEELESEEDEGDYLEDPEAPLISGAPSLNPLANQPQKVLSREERVEYRDQDGNVLDPEQVKALEGKVEFRTRYETRTRVVDANGNEIGVYDDEKTARPSAPPRPSSDGSAGSAADNINDSSNDSRNSPGNNAQQQQQGKGVAPPHPDAEGVETQTGKGKVVRADDPLDEGFQRKQPKADADAEVSADGENEKERSKAKPASEGNEATAS